MTTTTVASATTETTTIQSSVGVTPGKAAGSGRLVRSIAAVLDLVNFYDLEKHLVAFFTLFLTYMELTWGMGFAEHNAARPGMEIAAILAAIGVPLTALQAAVINFYFTARATSAAANAA